MKNGTNETKDLKCKQLQISCSIQKRGRAIVVAFDYSEKNSIASSFSDALFFFTGVNHWVENNILTRSIVMSKEKLSEYLTYIHSIASVLPYCHFKVDTVPGFDEFGRYTGEVVNLDLSKFTVE